MRDFKLYLFGLVCGFAGIFVHSAGVERPAHATASNDAVSVGSGVRFICQASAPAPVGRARLWVRCSDGKLIYTTAANADQELSL